MIFFTVENYEERLKIEELYYKYRNLMYKVSYDILQDKNMAEDAISEAFERILKNLHKIDEINCTKTRNFMVIICRNVSINMYNKRKKVSECELNDKIKNNNYEDPADIVVSKENIERMAKAISSMDNKYKDVFLLKHAHGMAVVEISKMLGITQDTVRKRLQRARKKIIENIEKEEIK